jgi:hypothetical protein
VRGRLPARPLRTGRGRSCELCDWGRLGVAASARRLEPHAGPAGADRVGRSRSAASGSARPAKRGDALSRKLLTAVLTFVLAGWLLRGERRQDDPSHCFHIVARCRGGGLGRRRLPLERCHRRAESIGGRRGERRIRLSSLPRPRKPPHQPRLRTTAATATGTTTRAASPRMMTRAKTAAASPTTMTRAKRQRQASGQEQG